MMTELQFSPFQTIFNLTFDEATKKVQLIDLKPIAFKLKEQTDWSDFKINQNIQFYQQFLALSLMYKDIAIGITEDADKVWHTHIYDTSKYLVDCQLVFGGYFHHFPYFGLRGIEDSKNLQIAAKKSHELYIEHFGISPFIYDKLSGEVALTPQAALCAAEDGSSCAKCITTFNTATDMNKLQTLLNADRPSFAY
jgi:hypothetical protein